MRVGLTFNIKKEAAAQFVDEQTNGNEVKDSLTTILFKIIRTAFR